MRPPWLSQRRRRTLPPVDADPIPLRLTARGQLLMPHRCLSPSSQGLRPVDSRTWSLPHGAPPVSPLSTEGGRDDVTDVLRFGHLTMPCPVTAGAHSPAGGSGLECWREPRGAGGRDVDGVRQRL